MPRNKRGLISEAIAAARALLDETGARSSRSRFYAGITDNHQRRLREHRVHPTRGTYATVKVSSAAVARHAERLLLAAGCKGGPGEGTNRTRLIYLYRVTPNTRE